MNSNGGHQPISRRSLLRRAALGFGALGLEAMLAESAGLFGASRLDNPIAPKPPHFAPKAKNVIFLFMHGGPSHIDTFDPKPRLQVDEGKPMPIKREVSFTPLDKVGGLMPSPFEFEPHGESGISVSSLFPNVGGCADDLCVVRSMVGDAVDHGGAMLQLHTGAFNFTRPSLGSWVLYGLGSENQNLPGFITIKPTLWHGGEKNWSSAFLPSAYQGTPIGFAPMDVADIQKEPIEHLVNKNLTSDQQRYELEMLQKINRRHALDKKHDPELEARIQSLELAFRMQMEAPEALSTEYESGATRKLYGLEDPVTRDFGWQCLMARRLVEKGVRFVQCTHSGHEEKWDHHRQVARRHYASAKEIDKPIAGLIKDLKGRGLLSETLVMWSGEFGRTPFAESDGRDHNPYGYTMWLAGGGVRGGMIHGATDEFGYHAVEDRMHIHDLHATVLHLLGFDHEKLTYPFDGRDFRLTDVHGTVVRDILA
jgi:hypothetical protein